MAIATKGLTHYDNNRKAKFITDWSKQGIGFVVM